MDTPLASRSECPVNLLPWYVNQTLTRTDRAAVEAHLAHCPLCQQDVAEWTDLRSAVQTIQPTTLAPRADLFAQIEARLTIDQPYQATSQQPMLPDSHRQLPLPRRFSSNGRRKKTEQSRWIAESSKMNQGAVFESKRQTAISLNQPRSLDLRRSGYLPTLAAAAVAFVLFGVLALNTVPRQSREPQNSSAGPLLSAPLQATPETGRTDDMEARIRKKLQAVQSAMPQWVQRGGKPEQIAPLMEQVEADLKQGKPADAEAVLDKVLAILGNPSQTTPGGSEDIQVRIQYKGQIIQTILPQWVQRGGKPEQISSLMQEVDADLKQGKPTDAEAVLDRILAILSNPPQTMPGGVEDIQPRIQLKAQLVQFMVLQWVQHGGKPEQFARLMQEVDANLKQGNLAEAEKILDKVLAMLISQTTSPVPCGTAEAQKP